MTNIEHFQLPIHYLEQKYKVQENILNDLELIQTQDASGISLYKDVFNPKTCFGTSTLPLWGNYYTDNKDFLKDSQTLLKKFKDIKNTANFDDMQNIWQEVKQETGFREKYQFVDWPWFLHFNHNSHFLQILSLYNLTSPVISLILPFVFLLLPFLILRLQGIPVTFTKYVEALKTVIGRHALDQLLTQFSNVSWEKRVYLIVSVCFYFFQIYQNMWACKRFYNNMKKIHNYLFTTRDYIDHTLSSMDNFLKYSSNLENYKYFNIALKEHYAHLTRFKHQLDIISPHSFSLKKVNQVGHVMKCFYDLYCQKDFDTSMHYSFGFNGYIDNITGLQRHLGDKNMNYCKFSASTSFKEAFYPSLINQDPVKNSYNLSKRLLITGPNAAGKTTMLKTTLFNILFSQQVGCGFYKRATISPYKHLHCYLNIPDTSGRDSLFQAEARRCKEILDTIVQSPSTDKHFCIFDELYSGTNPYEAVGSAFAFLKFLTKYPNVHFTLTTHYLDLCKKLETNRRIRNYHMNILEIKEGFSYTYELKKGISHIKGGVKVLKDLEYPEEIITSAIKTMHDCII